MSTEPDPSQNDEALDWEGDEPLTAPAPAPSLPRGWKAVGKGSDVVETTPEQSPTLPNADVAVVPGPTSNAALVTLGIFGGIYLLFTIGWIISSMNLQAAGEQLAAGAIPYAIASWVAAAAPAIWFTLSLYLTRSAKIWVRILWLIAGAVLLVPWPFVMMGVGA